MVRLALNIGHNRLFGFQMPKLTLLSPDGTFETIGLNMQLKNHYVDPNNPQRYIPKFCKCKHRDNRCRLSDCRQRIIFEWHCLLFDKKVGVKTCEECDAEKS